MNTFFIFNKHTGNIAMSEVMIDEGESIYLGHIDRNGKQTI